MPAKRAVIYARISEDRTGERAGVDRQLADCQALASSLNLDVVEVCEDNDISAYSGKPRPGWDRVITLIKRREVDAVLAWHTDRMYRRTRELEDLVDLINKHETEIHTVQGGKVDLTTPEGRLIAKSLGNLAQYESEHKAARIARAHQEIAKAGRWKGGRRPFGYHADGRTIFTEEAEAIREAARMLLEGHTMAAAARRVDEMLKDVPTPSGDPRRRKDPRSLRDTLLQPRIAGYRQHWTQKERVQFLESRKTNTTNTPSSIPWDKIYETLHRAEWEGVLDEETWQRVRALLLDPKRLAGRSRRPRRSMLAGMLRCAVCAKDKDEHGQPVVHTLGYNARSYSCNRCGQVAITVPAAERLITSKVEEALRRAAQEIPDDSLAAITNTPSKVAALDEREQVLIDQFTAGRLSRMALDRGLDQLKRDRDRLTSQERAAHEEHLRQLSVLKLVPEWESADDLQKGHIISLVADYFVVKPVSRTGRHFYPARVLAKWKDRDKLTPLGEELPTPEDLKEARARRQREAAARAERGRLRRVEADRKRRARGERPLYGPKGEINRKG